MSHRSRQLKVSSLARVEGEGALRVQVADGRVERAELNIYEHGGHGMGMTPGHGDASLWPRRAEEWLRDRKLIAR